MSTPKSFEMVGFPNFHKVSSLTHMPTYGSIRFHMVPGSHTNSQYIDVEFTDNGRGLILRGGTSLTIEPHVSNMIGVSLKDFT